MSTLTRPVPKQVVVCDLCRETISEQGQPLKRASLAHGYGGTPERAKATAWYLLWDPRNWGGSSVPSRWEQEKDPERWKYKHYDFHTECILRLVEREIAATTPARADR